MAYNQKRKLKIMHCAPISIEISPNLTYAGTQRIIYALNKGLSEEKIDSYVAGTGDSDLGGYGNLVATREKAIWPVSENGIERLTRSVDNRQDLSEQHYKKVLELAQEYKVDVIHDHGDFPSSVTYQNNWKKINIPVLVTEHCPISEKRALKFKKIKQLKDAGAPIYFVGISKSHKERCESKAGFDFYDFVYNGLVLDNLNFKNEKQDYLFWIGRMSSMKGTDLAIKIAKQSRKPIILAGVIHEPDFQFYQDKIKPLIDRSLENMEIKEQSKLRKEFIESVENGTIQLNEGESFFIGPVNDLEKSILYANAFASVLPNRWEEPFGLTFVESMATGTPVLGTTLGSIPELVKDGETGFLSKVSLETFDDNKIINDLAEKVNQISSLNFSNCRKHVETNFSLEKMTNKYLEIYQKIK